jgi:hypothetical protein
VFPPIGKPIVSADTVDAVTATILVVDDELSVRELLQH